MNFIEHLLSLHDRAFFQQEAGWLAYAQHVLTLRHQLPTDTALAEYVEQLIQYFQETGQGFTDRRYLEMACFIPGLQRGQHPPLMVLSARRGGFSRRRLAEAAAWVERCERIVTPFRQLPSQRLERLRPWMRRTSAQQQDDLTQVLDDLLALTHFTDAEIFRSGLLEAYRQMTSDDAEQLAQAALALWESEAAMDRQIAAVILNDLAHLDGEALVPYHQTLLERDILFPGVLFRKATSEISQRLIARLLSAPLTDIPPLLNALVWNDNHTAQQQIETWMAQPPAWWQNWFPNYPHEAGWEIVEQGKRRQLYFGTCFPLVATPQPATSVVLQQRDDACPLCGHPLDTLFDLDLTDPRLAFLSLTGSRLRILTCVSCVPWTAIVSEVDWQGRSVWSGWNTSVRPDRDLDYQRFTNTLTLAQDSRGTFEAKLHPSEKSQIGGFPFWFSGAHYPSCPQCSHAMQCVGQLDLRDIAAREGIVYGFLCTACQLAASTYDQT